MDDRTRRLLQRGRDHYHANEYDKAERALSPLARERHPFADVYGMLGVIYHQKGRLKEARAMLEEALRLNPGYTEAALNLAVTYNELGKYQEAKLTYERMMASRRVGGDQQLDPFVKGKIANMHAEVAGAYDQAGQFAAAADEYRRALSLCPHFVDIRTRLGASLRAAGDLPAAEREFQTAKGDNPNLVAPRLQLGMTYYAGGRYEDAAREWREVLAMEPENKFAKLYMRLLTASDGRPRRPSTVS